MKKSLAFWSEHIAAIKQEGISTSAYAKRHDLPLKSLYYWQRKALLATAPAKAITPKAFVTLRVSEPVAVSASMGCVLVLACGMRLEMPALPSPAWLTALSRSAQGAH
jgi:transposase-like protein